MACFAPMVTLAAPGCGKTEHALGVMREELAAGTPPDRIAVATFTRSARAEVQDRVVKQLGMTLADFPWVRTIHSMAARLLGIPKASYFGSKHLTEFAQKHGYTFTMTPRDFRPERFLDDPIETITPVTSDDDLRAAYEWGRARALPAEKVPAAFPCEFGLPVAAFAAYVARYEAFKAELGLLDYGDCLERAHKAWEAVGLAPQVDVAIVDEAQDLSAAQARLVEAWFAPCRRCVVVGDDDQEIMGFSGAASGWLLGLARGTQPRILPLSYRVPAAVQRVAGRIISRNRNRVPKRWAPRPGRGEVLRMRLTAGLDLAAERAGRGKTAFVLFRNRVLMRPAADRLLATRVPFRVSGAGVSCPYNACNGRIGQIVQIAKAIGDGGIPTGKDLALLLEYVRVEDGVLYRGAKAWAKTVKDSEEPIGDLGSEGLDGLIRRIRDVGPVRTITLGMDEPTTKYLATIYDKNGILPEPKIQMMTIHASKGREADVVVVLPDMTSRTWRGYIGDAIEEERRVWYVAVTRARETLVLCEPETERAFEWPSCGETSGPTADAVEVTA